MELRALHTRRLAAAVAFLAATLVLAVQLISPSPVVVRVGESGTNVAELGRYFQYTDVAVVAVASCVLGASGTYLLLGDRSTTDSATDGAPGIRRGDHGTGTEPVLTADGSTGSAPDDALLEARREEWTETAERLAGTEQEIYETLIDAEGVLPQSDIVDRTDVSKATVSRALDSLETKHLVERKRRGMGNVVLLR
jgi:DNA-binding transcriptional ArsR family regulator